MGAALRDLIDWAEAEQVGMAITIAKTPAYRRHEMIIGGVRRLVENL